MVGYKKLYLKSLGYTPSDFVCCEISGSPAIDIHHIIGRGKLGDDRIENLMALTRENHIKYGDKKKYMKYLFMAHRDFLEANGVKFDHNFFNEMIKKYDD